MIFSKKELWIVDIGSSRLKLMSMRPRPKPVIKKVNLIDYYQTGLVSRPEDLSENIIVQILKDILHTVKCNTHIVRAILSSQSAIVRTLEIPLVAEDDLKSVIRYNLSGLVPYSAETAEFDYTVWQTDYEHKVQIVIVSIAPPEEIKFLTEILSRVGLEPILLSMDLLAIYNSCALFKDWDERTVAFVHIGARRTQIIYFTPGKPPFFHVINNGADDITNNIAKSYQTSFLNAEDLKLNPTLSKTAKSVESSSVFNRFCQKLVSQITAALHDIEISHQLQTLTAPLKRIILTGGGAPTRELAFLLAQQMRVPVKMWNPFLSPEIEIAVPELDQSWGWHFLPTLGLACQEGLCG
jgi:type IV pilus assembly protein PilM